MAKVRYAVGRSQKPLEQRVEEWGLLKRGAVFMLFRAGETYESISGLVGCSPDVLKGYFPSPPSVADRPEYDAAQVIDLFRGEAILTDIEFTNDLHHPDASCRVKATYHDSGIKTIKREDLHEYLRGKAFRMLGIARDGVYQK